jgi:ADP-ribose pyrophosphatase YjhB (NUDIX family)
MSFSTCVRAFVHDPQGNILLVKHKEDRPWTLPWGHVEWDEELDGALQRELREEFAIEITFDTWSYEALEDFVRVQPLPITIHTIRYHNSRGEEVVKQELFYRAFTKDIISYQQTSEIFDWKWRTKEEILDSWHGVIYPNIVEIVKQKL